MAIITFTDTIGVPKEYEPILSSKFLPDWYKNTSSYAGNEKKPDQHGKITPTIKRCIPVWDSLTAGYLILTYVDVYVTQVKVSTESEETQPWYAWPSYVPLEFHDLWQLPNGHPYDKGHTEGIPKWMNPWAIKTPPGYSTLILQPMHHPSIFTILPGIVDTDRYNATINFPFMLNNINFEGLIPAGTPIAQIIPFKRESWKNTIQTTGELLQKSFEDKLFINNRFFDKYKKSFWQRKEYS
jgi:hypothetical protein